MPWLRPLLGCRRVNPAASLAAVQRLFSAFPDGWPGAGLLLLRLAIVLPPLGAQFTLGGAGVTHGGVLRAISSVDCTLIAFGLMTPFAAAAQVASTAWLESVDGVFDITHCAHLLLGLSLMMLGPGAWSVDARLFGRRRIDVDVS